MKSPFEQFGTSGSSELSGVWLNFGTFEISVARAGGKNLRYDKVREQYFKDFRRAAELGELSDDIATPILAEVYADTIVQGWRTRQEDNGYVNTIIGPEGEPWEYNRANVVKFLSTLPDLFRIIRMNSENWQNFRQALVDDAVKN